MYVYDNFLVVSMDKNCLLRAKGLSSLCYEITQIAGIVEGTGAAPPTSKLGRFLSRSLALIADL